MTIHSLTPWNWFRNTTPRATDIPSQSGNTNEHPLLNLQRDIDQIFDNFFQGFSQPSLYGRNAGINAMASPKINIAETNDTYQITAELPGVTENDVDVSLSQGVLTIKGEKKEEKEEKERNFHRIESSYGAFQRSIALPENADADNVNATFRNGILSITVRKNATAQAETKKIPINTEAA